MACKGCKDKAKKFKEAIMSRNKEQEEQVIMTAKEQERRHLMNVCKHGVPAGFKCGSCDKVIEIPEDAVIKPAIPVKPEGE